MAEIKAKVALVTGASSGIGEATAKRLAGAGYKVYGTSRRGAEAGQRSFEMLALDVTSDESVAAAVAEVIRREGRIDLLVNNAGIGLIGGAEESSLGQVKALFDVNLFGVIRMSNAVLPAMRQGGGGRIINVSSVLGLMPAPFSAHYSATKHALEGYSESLDHELRAFNIRVSLIEPAYTRSVFEQNALAPDMVLKDYDQARTGALALVRDVMPTADPPEIVADTVVRAATAPTPRRRYTAGKVARQIAILRRFAPAEMFDKSLRKQMRLPV